ncbi:TonB-dependent receptor [Pseudoflavitalea rhizosphaerae]|uniref:TonB-dependent receptor n=1 Tax=Pseudoflavitalea rhizosphaerae TaxID=1884793 RepID=UPI000F8D8EB5|nr:TonB-dependent receptor [Pseudoflavitalea rhizosphaerae]
MMKIALVLKRSCLLGIVLIVTNSCLFAQDNKKITLTAASISYEDIFETIRQQTGLIVFYSNRLLNDKERISVDFQSTPLSAALQQIFSNKPIGWNFNNKFIVLRKKAEEPAAQAPTVEAVSGIKVQGLVTDEKASPVSNVTVKLKGASSGVMTDALGKYSITVPNEKSVLVFTHVNSLAEEILVGKKQVINISLKSKDDHLTDVVVIGYGTTRKKDVTASISSVSKEALSDRTLLSLADAMKGKASGVQIIQNDGTPGSENTIRIRGASSISAGSTPLFVIDGVLQDDANTINPGDIESIEILKDASGTAIYGARGANGVILITTKTGKTGKTRVELYSNIGFQRAGHLYNLMDASEYAHARYLASGYVWSPPDPNDPNKPASTQAGITYYRDRPLGEPASFWGVSEDNAYRDWQNFNHPDSVNTDWQRAMFQKSKIQEYRFNVSGGNASTKFSLMGGYLNQDGLVVYSGYQRYNARFNIQQRLSKAVQLTGNILGTRTETNGFITGSYNGGITSNAVVTSMLQQPPVKPLTFTDVDDNEGIEGYITSNPYSLAQKVTNNRYSNEWLARMAIDWTINNNFKFRTTGTYSNINTNTDAYYPSYTRAGSKYKGRAVLSRGAITKMMNENLLYYKGRIGDAHRFNAMGGAIVEQYRNNLLTAENQGYDIELLGPYGLGNGTVPIIPTYTETQWRMVSFLGRLEYSLQEKYLATITMRADGSSRFSKHNKWGYFPSAALAWRVSEEPFMRNLKFISSMKLRTSLGQSGNTAIPPYLTLSTITTYLSPMDGVTPNFGVVVERPENSSLKWETTTQLDAGMDMTLFNDKVSLTVDWYTKRTDDLLIQVVTPAYSGYRKTWTNLGSIRNSGIELTIGTSLMKKNHFSWSIDANIGLNRSKAIEVGPDLSLDPGVVAGIGAAAIIRNGQTIGQWYGYQTNGIFQSYEEIRASGLTMINGQAISAIRPGTRRFIDQNNDGVINSSDRVVVGQGQPEFTGGITNTFAWRGFSLNAVVQYSYGNRIFNANRVALEAGRSSNNMTKAAAGGWSPSLYDMNTGKLEREGNPGNTYRMPGSPEELLMMDVWVEDGSYIRLSDITIAYSFPVKITKKYGVQGLSLFASGKNLWVLTDYSGYDPEVNTRQGGFGDLMPSLDYASYPRSRVYSFGLKVQF